MGSKRPPLDEVLALFQATVAAEGVTTGAGAAAGTSIVDAALALSGANSFFSMLMVLYPGQPRLVDSMDITGFNNATGEVIFSTAYKGIAAAIPAGVPYKIVTFRFVPAEVAAIEAKLDLPAPDSGLNTRIAEVVGNETDTIPAMNLAPGVTDSIIRHIKAILERVGATPADPDDSVLTNLGQRDDAATLDDMTDVTTTSIQAKLRRILLRMSGAGIFSADIQGAARTELDTMLAQLAVYFNLGGAVLGVTMNPGAGSRASLQLILQDLGDMLAGGTGIVTFPTPRALPANGVSLAEVERYIAEVKPEWAARTAATHTTTGVTEETILTTAYTVPGLFYFNLTLRNMVAGDDFTIRVYKRVDGANYDLKSEQQFVGAPTIKVYEVEGIYSDGTEFIRVTIQRASATDRAFPYSVNFLRQPVA